MNRLRNRLILVFALATLAVSRMATGTKLQEPSLAGFHGRAILQ